MALPNEKRALQDRLSRIATRLGQKFGYTTYPAGSTTGAAGFSGGIPLGVLVNRAGKKIVAENLGRENASALSFNLVDPARGAGVTSAEVITVQTYYGLTQSLPVGFYGSATALVMLGKLKAGTDSVDFLVTGDSNTNSPGGQGWFLGLARGCIRGCSASMYASPIYPLGVCASVPVFPTAWRGGNGSQRVSARPIGSAEFYAPGTTTASDIRNAPDDVRSFWDMSLSDPGFGFDTGSPRGTYKTSALWISHGNGVTWTSNSGEIMGIEPFDASKVDWQGSGMDTRKALTARVVHSVLPGNGASASQVAMFWSGLSTGIGYTGAFDPHAYLWGQFTVGGNSNPFQLGATSYPPVTSVGVRGFTASAFAGINGVTAKTVSKLTWPADANRVGVTIGFFLGQPGTSPSFGGGSPWNRHVKGPIAIYAESVHNNSKGWAITPMIQLSGFTTEGVVNEIVSFGSTGAAGFNNSAFKTVLQEARERQIEAGGSGNVIAWLNTGINDVGQSSESLAAQVYPIQLKRMVLFYKRAWDELGYPENELAFMISVTHPTAMNDTNQDSLRVVGKNYANTGYDAAKVYDPYSNVTFIDINELGTGLLGTTHGGLSLGNAFNGFNNFYQNANGQPGDFPAHLSSALPSGFTGGYAYLAELLMKRALRYTPPLTPNPV